MEMFMTNPACTSKDMRHKLIMDHAWCNYGKCVMGYIATSRPRMWCSGWTLSNAALLLYSLWKQFEHKLFSLELKHAWFQWYCKQVTSLVGLPLSQPLLPADRRWDVVHRTSNMHECWVYIYITAVCTIDAFPDWHNASTTGYARKYSTAGGASAAAYYGIWLGLNIWSRSGNIG